jgi:hypothetical protein
MTRQLVKGASSVTEETAVYMTAPTKNGEAPLPRRGGPKGMRGFRYLGPAIRPAALPPGGEW